MKQIEINDRAINAFAELFDIDPETVRIQVEVGGMTSLLRAPGSVLTTPEQLEKHEAFMVLRQSLFESEKPDRLNSPGDVARFAYENMHVPHLQENFIVILLDTKNQPLAIEQTGVGTLDSAIVHPRDVFRKAVMVNARSIIVTHNHPSGDPNPSDEDIAITQRLAAVGEMQGIPLLDHVIITGDDNKDFFSFKAHGMMDIQRNITQDLEKIVKLGMELE